MWLPFKIGEIVNPPVFEPLVKSLEQAVCYILDFQLLKYSSDTETGSKTARWMIW